MGATGSWTRFKGMSTTKDGYCVGAKGSETLIISSAGIIQGAAGVGYPLQFDFASGSAAQTIYSISPVTGNVTAGYVCCDTSARTTTLTAQLGSAGTTLATATQASGVAGVVSVFTLGTVAVTAGASISVTRAAMGSTGSGVVILNIQQTA